MHWLNFNHLLYFWSVVQEGSIAAASRLLHVGRPSISMQLKTLEASLGGPLFHRRGRNLELTELGKLVHRYADEIFQTGQEMVDAVRGRPTGRQVFRVGIAEVMAKLVTHRLLQPAIESKEYSLVCREDHPTRLFAQLAVHDLDLVLSDMPPTPGIDVKIHGHVLGSSTVTLFAAPELAAELAPGFPESLHGAPFLMPPSDTAVRRALDVWLADHELVPLIAGEIQDSALLKVFGQSGGGVFPAPTVVEPEIVRQYDVQPVGCLEDVRETFYAVSAERRIRHGAVARVVEQAREQLFDR